MNMSRGFSTTIALLLVLVALGAGAAAGGWYVQSSGPVTPADQMAQAKKSDATTEATITLSKNMRKLWEDHITWTRMYIVSATYNNKDTEDISNRLLKNQEDIGAAIAPYYGLEAGQKLTSLLKTHITGAVELISAAKAGDKTAQSRASEAWDANANEIAGFLSSANPNWPKDQVLDMLRDHLDATKQEATNILSNNFKAGIADYDRVHGQILTMADAITDGIVKQFPDRFD